MLSACITRWSTVIPLCLSLLLVMSTLPSILLLPTAQSSSVRGVMSSQLWLSSMASNLSITVNRTTLTNGPLSQSAIGTVSNCVQFMANKGAAIANACALLLVNWVLLVSVTGGSEAKVECVNQSLVAHCLNIVACYSCSPDQYAPYRDWLKPGVAKSCEAWPNWVPRLECSPMASDVALCGTNISVDSIKCTTKAALSIAKNIKDPTEALCKITYASDKCMVKLACKQCEPDTATKLLDAETKEWSPKEAQCTKWSSNEPKMECSSNMLLIVGIILAVIVLLVVIGVLVYCKCFASGTSDGGGRSSNKPSSHHSGQPGSSVGAKQSSALCLQHSQVAASHAAPHSLHSNFPSLHAQI